MESGCRVVLVNAVVVVALRRVGRGGERVVASWKYYYGAQVRAQGR